MKIKFLSFIPAVAWLIITTILLCLPGNNLPKSDFFNIPYFDKFVHLGIFFLLTYLFSLPLKQLPSEVLKKRRILFQVALYCLIYGIVMEFVQDYLIPYRSYDVWDIVVDAIGCLLAYMWSTNSYLKSYKV